MSLELGLFLGARKWGRRQSQKRTLILDREAHRYQAFISDIAGQDIHSHAGEVARLIEQTATWLRDQARDPDVPGGRAIAAEFTRFLDELTFQDLTSIATGWILTDSGAA